MGEPQDRQFKEKNEAWQYAETELFWHFNNYRIVWFYDGKVTGMNSYKTTRGSSESGFKQTDWREAPDISVEVLNK